MARRVYGLRRRFIPLLITLDVMMPEMDGWSVLKQLKADPELAEIPVIMVSIVDNEPMGIELGASNYLIKPVDRDRLAVLVEQYGLVRSSGENARHTASSGRFAVEASSSDGCRKQRGSITSELFPEESQMPKILLVEDNEMNRDMLSRRLQRRGYHIVTAENGEAGTFAGARGSARPDPHGHNSYRKWTVGKLLACLKADERHPPYPDHRSHRPRADERSGESV